MQFLNWEGKRHRPGGGWQILIRAGSVVAALYVLWIGALAQITGNTALWLATRLHSELLLRFAGWARAFTANWHLDISIFMQAEPGAAGFPFVDVVRAPIAPLQVARRVREAQEIGESVVRGAHVAIVE